MNRNEALVRLSLLLAATALLLFAAVPVAGAVGHVTDRFGPLGGLAGSPPSFGEPCQLSFGYPLIAIDVTVGTDTSDVYAWAVGSSDLTASLLWSHSFVFPGTIASGVIVFESLSPDPAVRWGVWARDVANGNVEFPISVGGSNVDSRAFPRISGNTVVWNEKHAGQWDIRGATFDPATRLVTKAFWVARRPTSEKYPSIAGDWVVWMDKRGGNWDIYGRNLTTGLVKAICTNGAKQDQPWMDGTWVVWRDWRNRDLSGADIYGRRLVPSGPTVAICRARRVQEEPRVAAGFVVWTDWRKAHRYGVGLHDTDVFAWDTVSKNVFRVAGGPYMEHGAETANGVVMYLRHTGEFRDMPWKGSVRGANLAH